MSPSLGPDEARTLADALEASWRTAIISFWYPRAIDPAGGYRVGWDARGRPARDERGTVSQARLVYVFARAARAGHRPDAMLAAAHHGLAYLRDVLWDAEHGGFVWSLEATTYTFAWLVLIGMSYGVRTEAHIAVDLVTSRLTPGGARAFAFIALAAGLAYCALMIYGSAQFIERSLALGNNARDIPLPRWLLTGIMPIAFGLLALRLVQAAHPVLWPRAAAGGNQ